MRVERSFDGVYAVSIQRGRGRPVRLGRGIDGVYGVSKPRAYPQALGPNSVRDDSGDLPPLEAGELFMCGAGRAERTVRDGLATLRALERHAERIRESPSCGPSSSDGRRRRR